MFSPPGFTSPIYMTRMVRLALIPLAAALMAAPAAAAESAAPALQATSAAVFLQMQLQCVPYARAVSGIQIYGDAHTWWKQAEGKYARGQQPKVGAVMAFKPYGRMELGHVAAVSKIIDSRTVLLRHANWSPINGERGQIEDDVRAIDVSENNDWSKVRVWFAPIEGIGGTAWPVQGFIYNKKPGKAETAKLAKRKPALDERYADDRIGAIIAAAMKY
jgi:surface antigen